MVSASETIVRKISGNLAADRRQSSETPGATAGPLGSMASNRLSEKRHGLRSPKLVRIPLRILGPRSSSVVSESLGQCVRKRGCCGHLDRAPSRWEPSRSSTPATYLHARTRRGRTSPEAPFRMSGFRGPLIRWKSNRDQPNQPGQIALARSHTSAIHVFIHGIIRWTDGRVLRHCKAINRRNLLDNNVLKNQYRILTARSSGGTPRNLEPHYSKPACERVRIDLDSELTGFLQVTECRSSRIPGACRPVCVVARQPPFVGLPISLVTAMGARFEPGFSERRRRAEVGRSPESGPGIAGADPTHRKFNDG